MRLAIAPDDAVLGDRVESSVAIGATLTGTVERVEGVARPLNHGGRNAGIPCRPGRARSPHRVR